MVYWFAFNETLLAYYSLKKFECNFLKITKIIGHIYFSYMIYAPDPIPSDLFTVCNEIALKPRHKYALQQKDGYTNISRLSPLLIQYIVMILLHGTEDVSWGPL